ncbi:MAG: hypothetical protein NC311_16710 [Muribaculaceae bacterium]|nr:hypothetical protein [Muribaculaceae bacterium]
MDYANIILEMLERIKKLENEVSQLKKFYDSINFSGEENLQCNPSTPNTINKRDTSRYLFEGNVYLKNRLVLAVVKSYIEQNNTITRQELKQVFNKSLQGSIGVVENIEIAQQRTDYYVRFFTKENEILHLNDGDMYVCTQWGILNIPYFIAKADDLGFKIEKIK